MENLFHFVRIRAELRERCRKGNDRSNAEAGRSLKVVEEAEDGASARRETDFLLCFAQSCDDALFAGKIGGPAGKRDLSFMMLNPVRSSRQEDMQTVLAFIEQYQDGGALQGWSREISPVSGGKPCAQGFRVYSHSPGGSFRGRMRNASAQRLLPGIEVVGACGICKERRK